MLDSAPNPRDSANAQGSGAARQAEAADTHGHGHQHGHGHTHDADSDCYRCSSALSQPLVCEGCGLLQPVSKALDPFQIFSLDRSAAIDEARLRRRLTALSRRMHPDFFSNESAAERERALASTAELNSAFELLSDETQRLNWLIGEGGGPSPEQERQMPAPFLAEVLEWNETLETAAGGGDAGRATLEALAQELDQRLSTERQGLRSLLTPLPEHGSPLYRQARKALNAIRYLERARAEATERLLEQRSQSR